MVRLDYSGRACLKTQGLGCNSPNEHFYKLQGPELNPALPETKKQKAEWQRDGSAKGTCCSSRGFQHPCQALTPSATPAPGHRMPLASTGTWTHVHIATYRHTQPHMMENKNIFFKSILNIIYLFIYTVQFNALFRKILFCMWVFSVHVCMCSACICVPESRRESQAPWTWSYRKL